LSDSVPARSKREAGDQSNDQFRPLEALVLCS
jgi:hypothetical protein